MDLAKQEAIIFFAEFLEKSWYCEFGLKDTLTIFNFCHDQKYQFQNTIIISKLLSKPKMTTASLIKKKIRIRTQFLKSHGIQKDCYILNLKKKRFLTNFQNDCGILNLQFFWNELILSLSNRKKDDETLMTKVGVNILLSTISFWKNLLTSYYPSWPFSMSFFPSSLSQIF